jgi:hypothetical protein
MERQAMIFTTRIDYLDLDGKLLFSDPVTGDIGKVKLRDCEAIDAWNIVYWGLEDEDGTEIVELARISRVTEIDGGNPRAPYGKR